MIMVVDVSEIRKSPQDVTQFMQGQLSPEQWQLGMMYFEKFLKEIRFTRDKNDPRIVHVDWVFMFDSEELAALFLKTAQKQFIQQQEQEQ